MSEEAKLGSSVTPVKSDAMAELAAIREAAGDTSEFPPMPGAQPRSSVVLPPEPHCVLLLC